MNIEQKVNLHNRFDIEVIDGKTGEVKQKAEAYNIVLDQMYTRLCGGSSYFVNIHFGTGTGTLAPSRTSLFTHLGTKTAVNEELIKAIPVSSWKRKIVLNPEEFVGSTITEVGIAFGATASNLVTHAMLKDAEGNPISITKTDTDVINIYATVFVTFAEVAGLTYLGMPSGNALVNYLIGGGSAPTGSFGLNEISFANSRLGSTSSATWTSDTANKQRKTNVPRFSISTGNGHVKSLDFTNVFDLKLPATGIFSGQAYSGVPIGTGDGVITAFNVPSRNIKDTSLVVKINGVTTSAFSLNDYPVGSDLVQPPSMLARVQFVGLSPDGSALAVGTDTNAPYIKVYDWTGSAWAERNAFTMLPATVKEAAFSYDGSVLAVGIRTMSPYIKIYDWVGSTWIERATPPNMPANGYAVALSPDGSVLAVGTFNVSPYIKVYDWTGSAWTERAQPPNMPSYGNSVDLSSDGSVLAVGTATASPYIKIYDWTGSAWTERAQPPNMPSYGYSVSLSSDGSVLAIGANTTSPYVKIYDWTGSAWTERAQPPNTPTKGYSVSLSSDGSVLAVGASNDSPYIKVYDWTGSAWTERAQPINMPGRALSVGINSDGSILAVAADNVSPYLKVYDMSVIKQYVIDFNTPPAIGDVITADYTVDGVHKTDQYVIDVSFAIQFGEGV